MKEGQLIAYQLDGQNAWTCEKIVGVGPHSVRVNAWDGVREAVRLDQIRELFQKEIHVVFWIEDDKPCSMAFFDFNIAERLFFEVQDREVYCDMVTRTVNIWQKINTGEDK